jgi:hypothetical protein
MMMLATDDKVLTTVEQTDTAGEANMYITEQLVERTNGSRYTLTTKRKVTKPQVLARRKWKHFGNRVDTAISPALARKIESEGHKISKYEQCCIGSDVFLEFVNPKKLSAQEWIPNGLYVGHARKAGWSPEEITSIIRYKEQGVLRPDKRYLQLYEMKLRILIAEAKIKCQRENGVPVSALVPLAPGAKVGLRDRMMRKTFSRQQAVESGETPTGLSALLEQKRSNHADSEQKCTVFLENVPVDYDETDIKEHLFDYDIRRVNIVRRENQYGVKESVGKAFVECNGEEVAVECLKYLNGARWQSAVISAVLSKPKPKPDPNATVQHYTKNKPMPRYKTPSTRR